MRIAAGGHGGLPAVALLAAALAACAPVSFEPPARENPAPAQRTEKATRDVVAGDTLYSIAWETGHDYRELARWNDIPPPYLIKPGQTLRLTAPEEAKTPTPATPAPQSHTVLKGETLYHIALTYDLEVADLARWNRIAAPYRIKPGQKLRLVAPAADEGKKRGAAKKSAAPRRAGTKSASKPAAKSGAVRASAGSTRPIPVTHVGGWIWPTDGAVLDRFGNGGSKGIDVGGRKGQAIRAANEGEVVYQGGGLRGYGQLIIVKHSAEFLSAYAHCDRIYVKEGDVIKRGQKIADMGSSATDRPMLHFEIRYRGTPVDPLRYLPKK